MMYNFFKKVKSKKSYLIIIFLLASIRGSRSLLLIRYSFHLQADAITLRAAWAHEDEDSGVRVRQNLRQRNIRWFPSTQVLPCLVIPNHFTIILKNWEKNGPPPHPTLSEAKTDRNNLNTELIPLLHIEL